MEFGVNIFNICKDDWNTERSIYKLQVDNQLHKVLYEIQQVWQRE